MRLTNAVAALAAIAVLAFVQPVPAAARSVTAQIRVTVTVVRTCTYAAPSSADVLGGYGAVSAVESKCPKVRYQSRLLPADDTSSSAVPTSVSKRGKVLQILF